MHLLNALPQRLDPGATPTFAGLISASLTAPAATNLTLTGGSTGASLVLGQGANGIGTFNRKVSITGAAATESLLVTGTANEWSERIQASTTSGQSYGILVRAGTTSADKTLQVFEATGTTSRMLMYGDTGNLLIGGTTDIPGSGGLKVFGTTAASTSQSGAFQVGGSTAALSVGIGGGNVNAGGGITGATVNGSTYVISPLYIAPTTLTLRTNGGSNTPLVLSGDAATFAGAVTTTNGTITANAGTGALTIAGSNTSATGFGAYLRGGSTQASGKYSLQLVNYDASKNYLFYDDIATMPGALTIASTTASTGVGSGALQVAGGIYAGAASVFGSTVGARERVTVTSTSDIRNFVATGNLTEVGYQWANTGTGAKTWTAWSTANSSGLAANGSWILRNETDGITALSFASTGGATFAGAVAIGNTVNTVSPTSPNRTVTMVIGGVTYYLAAKTTND